MEPGSRTIAGTWSIDHVPIEIEREDEKNLTLSIKEQMDIVSASNCICRVPHDISKDNEEFYFPQLVSIGPFHKLPATEDKKWRYLNALLNRKPNIESSLKNCVKALKALEPKVQRFYGEEINLSSDELVKTMLLDGCFIIELLLKYSIKGLRRRDDPFFSKKVWFYRLRRDMMLLENQLPLFVLQRLFNLVPIPNQCTQTLPELALIYFRKMVPGDFQFLQEQCISQDFSHLLDLIHNSYLPTYPEEKSWGGQRDLHCAARIRKSGIVLKPAKKTRSLLDIKFGNGVLEIPPLKVFHYDTEILFRNLVAFEHCYRDRTKHVSSYVFLMGSLVQSEKDLRLLSKTGILAGERKEEVSFVLDLFKKIRMGMDAKDFYYKGICEEVNRYERTGWRPWCWKIKER